MKRVFHRRNIVSFLFVFCKIAHCITVSFSVYQKLQTVIKLKKKERIKLLDFLPLDHI